MFRIVGCRCCSPQHCLRAVQPLAAALQVSPFPGRRARNIGIVLKECIAVEQEPASLVPNAAFPQAKVVPAQTNVLRCTTRAVKATATFPRALQLPVTMNLAAVGGGRAAKAVKPARQRRRQRRHQHQHQQTQIFKTAKPPTTALAGLLGASAWNWVANPS